MASASQLVAIAGSQHLTVARAQQLTAVYRHGGSFIGTIDGLISSAGTFFERLASLSWPSLLIGLALYGLYLLLRSRALYAALRAAYPGGRVRWRDVWGAYMVGYAVNNVFPLGGGNVAQLFLTRIAIPGSSYPTIATALSTGLIFDWFAGLAVMCFAFTQGVFPKPPDFAKLPAFDISFFASHMRFTLFVLTALGVAYVVAFAVLSARVRAFWRRIRQGLAILADRRRWRREMASWQLASWVARFFSYWALLDAFHIGGSVRNALLVLAVQVVASVFPFTPGGAGVQQALLLTIFSRSLDTPAFSVGQQIATAVMSSAMGFAALVVIFRLRSFREVVARAREHRRQEARGGVGAVAAAAWGARGRPAGPAPRRRVR
ncbi:MAG TPA: lysylphosphatidylglycerol synthase transmembrane domain-containing protein [Solirubrobacteraceae bacterium]|nr:lysylphosphatidylglycerol synthase transmembrane domain-containing protein [Solirubrobacteraceae bacterium]